MPEQSCNSGRKWREIAEEICREKNPSRIVELCDEMKSALEDQQGATGTTTDRLSIFQRTPLARLRHGAC